MENKELKENIKRNIKEEIAISNIRKELYMKEKMNKKMLYTISSACAVLILCVGVFIGTNNVLQNENVGVENYLENKNKEVGLSIKLNVNKLKDISMMSLDADVKTLKIEEIPDKFNFINQINIPKDYKLEDMYNIYTRENSNSEEYNILHDYFFYYRKDELNKINMAFSEIESPLRDYYIDSANKISKIDNIELIVSQYNNMYMSTFKCKNLYFDIETVGITADELVSLLESIINSVNKNVVIEKDMNVNEQPSEILTSKYPNYYAGKYVDNSGNNVILLRDDTIENRKEICSILGITENKTIFKKAEYTYEYLTDLQSRISKKMQDKELPFVTSSSLMEDSNNIKVTVISNDVKDLNKIKELDIIGGAIDIEYSANEYVKQDLSILE